MYLFLASKRFHFKRVPPTDEEHLREPFDSMMENISDESTEKLKEHDLVEYVCIKNEDVLENLVYNYNEKNLSKRCKKVVNSVNDSKRRAESQNPSLASSFTEKGNVSLEVSKQHQRKEINCNILEMNTPCSFFDSISEDVNENLSKYENKMDFDFYPSNNAYDDLLLENSPLEDLYSKNCNKRQALMID